MYKIEKGVKPVRSDAVANSFPFEKMKVGDSFLLDDVSKLNSLKVAAYTYNTKNKGVKMSVLKHGDGFRCHRVK